jgi:hypothetical protein
MGSDPKNPAGKVYLLTKYRRRPEYLRGRAAEARAKAEDMNDDAARETMLSVADNWETMAQIAERFPR